jgi:DNA repair ATPase RecN
MASPVFELRLTQLENNLTRVATRIYEYQTELEDENDPNRKSQYCRRVEQLKKLLSEYQSEYDELKGYRANESSIEMQEVSN